MCRLNLKKEIFKLTLFLSSFFYLSIDFHVLISSEYPGNTSDSLAYPAAKNTVPPILY